MILVHRLVALIQAITAVLMLIPVAVNFANIIGRYVFFAPIASAEEVMLFLMVGMVFLGNSVVGFTYPDAWRNFHLPWAAMALAILTFGGGRIALDGLLGFDEAPRR